jgi:hypothetical protein
LPAKTIGYGKNKNFKASLIALTLLLYSTVSIAQNDSSEEDTLSRNEVRFNALTILAGGLSLS